MARSLKQTVTVADVRELARRRLPRMAFDFIDGGAEDEVTYRANREAFEAVVFRPRPWDIAASPDLSVTVGGCTLSMPVILAPCGNLRLIDTAGERGAAAAAGATGTAYALSTMGQYSIEEVAAAAAGPLWFQIHPVGGDASVAQAVDRAVESGYRAMVIMVDAPTAGLRERDVRNNVAALSGGELASLVRIAPQVLNHPRWLYNVLRDRVPTTFPNVVLDDGRPLRLSGFHGALSAIPDAWKQIATLRKRWDGPIFVKGILDTTGARRAVEAGASGIIVSNHGGRQLDGVPAALSRLPAIAAAVGRDAEVLLDSGVRRGTDVVKALCLGAKAVLIGRPYVYGLAAGGWSGVERVLEIFRTETVRTLTLLGCDSIADLGPDFVEAPSAWTR